MDPLELVWRQHGEKLDIGNFRIFLQELSIVFPEKDLDVIFTMLDVNQDGFVEFKEVRMFFNVAKVYDKDRYPTNKVKSKKRKRKKNKVHPINL